MTAASLILIGALAMDTVASFWPGYENHVVWSLLGWVAADILKAAWRGRKVR